MTSNKQLNDGPFNYGSQLQNNRDYYSSGSTGITKNDTNRAQDRVNQMAASNKAFMNAMLSPRGRQQNWEAMKRAPLVSSFVLVQLVASSIPLATLLVIASFMTLASLSIAAFVASFTVFWAIVFLSPIFFFTVPAGVFLWLGIVLAWKTWNYFQDDIYEQTTALQAKASDVTTSASRNIQNISHTVQANAQDLASELQQNASAISDGIVKTKQEIEENADKEYHGYRDNVRENTDKVAGVLQRSTNTVVQSVNNGVNKTQDSVNAGVNRAQDSFNSGVNQAQGSVNNAVDRSQQIPRNNAQQIGGATYGRN